MRIIGIFFVLLSLLPLLKVSGQRADTCNCLANLDTTIEKVEANYAGFTTKVNANTQGSYLQLRENTRKKAAGIGSAKQCFYLLKGYVRFFKDKHMVLSYLNQADADSDLVPLSVGNVKRKMKSLPLSPEGIWRNPDTSMRIAIIKNAKCNLYKAVVLESKDPKLPSGLVIFTLTPQKNRFLLQQYNVFSSTDMYARQRANLLQLWNFELWGREYPGNMNEKETEELGLWKNRNNGLECRKIDSANVLLKIPSFFNNDNKIEKLVDENDSMIRSTPNLIVDLRGNGGGNTGWIYFLRYFMTNPVVQKNTFLRVSKANVSLKMTEIGPVLNNPVPGELKKYFTGAYLNKLRKAAAELPVTEDSFYAIPNLTIPLDSVTAYPGKIALVVDDLCGSSAEYFLYLSRQSRKTTSYGVNTVGMMDYEGVSTPTTLPYSRFNLLVPVSKSSWTDTMPIDQTGFSPDVTVDLPHDRWIDFIIKDLPSR